MLSAFLYRLSPGTFATCILRKSLSPKANRRSVEMQDASPEPFRSLPCASEQDEPKLKDQLQAACRRKGYALSTERTYWRWVLRYVRFCARQKGALRHPRTLGAPDVRRFLSYLATEREVATGTQSQALNALGFLYGQVLGQDLSEIGRFERGKTPKRLPAVLTRSEVRALLSVMSGTPRLVASLLYGSGLRLSEALRLRVKDLDFERARLLVRQGKGKKDRVTMLPPSLHAGMRRQLRKAEAWHAEDLEAGVGGVHLPLALRRKYPNAAREWAWHWVFSSKRLSEDPRGGKRRRHHLSRSHIQRRVRRAVQASGLAKKASCHTLRHSFATHLLEDGYDVRTVQRLLGRKSLDTTMIYTRLAGCSAGAQSPLERL